MEKVKIFFILLFVCLTFCFAGAVDMEETRGEAFIENQNHNKEKDKGIGEGHFVLHESSSQAKRVEQTEQEQHIQKESSEKITEENDFVLHESSAQAKRVGHTEQEQHIQKESSDKVTEENDFVLHESSAQVKRVENKKTDLHVLELSLEEVIEDVVFYNPTVEKMRLEWLSSCMKTKTWWSIFEPHVVGSYESSSLERKNTFLESLQQGGAKEFLQRQNTYNINLEGDLFSGANYNIGYSLTDNKNNINASEEAESSIGASVKQPLLKGTWFGCPLVDIKISKIDRIIAFHNFRTEIMKSIYDTETTYWNLYFAEEKKQIASESVDIAKKLVQDSKERFKVGKMSQLKLFTTEAELAIRLARKANLNQQLLEAMNRLKLLLSSDRISHDTGICTKTPMYNSDAKMEIISEDDIFIDEIIRFQPDYLVKWYEFAKQKLKVKYQKNQSLPELNAQGRYGFNGLGDDALEAWRTIEERKKLSWGVGLELRIPLFVNIKGRKEIAAEKLKKQIIEENLKAVEYRITSSVRNLIQRMVSLRECIKNFNNIVDYQKRRLDFEFSRLAVGKSTIHKIYKIEEKLSEAKQQALENIVRYKEAEIQFELISGVLLRNKGFEIIESGKPVLLETILQPAKGNRE